MNEYDELNFSDEVNMDSLRNFDEATGQVVTLPDGTRAFDPRVGVIGETPKPGRGVFTAKKNTDGIITLRLQNFTNSQKRVEIFNFLRHITKVPANDQYSKVAAPLYQPLNTSYSEKAFLALSYSLENELLACAGAANYAAFQVALGTAAARFGEIYNPSLKPFAVFDEDGSLRYISTTNYANIPTQGFTDAITDAKITAAQMPYSTLVSDTESLVLLIRQIKMLVKNASQFYNSLDVVRYSSLGAVLTDNYEPSSFIQPENQQSLVINMNKNVVVDSQTAIYVTLEPNEDVQLNLSISAYRNNAVKW